MSSKMKAVKSLPFWLDNKIQKWYPILNIQAVQLLVDWHRRN